MVDLCFSKPESCCGCGACACICPQQAIRMEYSDKGFKYPIIDQEKCVDCNACVQVCDFKRFVPTDDKPECYAARHKDSSELETSRSGGFFMALCRQVIDNDGVVFGCIIDKDMFVKHIYVDKYEECKQFKGSKYVQSDLMNTFNECLHFLENDRHVLFSGTGCQIHGLLSFLKAKKAKMEKLITVDIVCHGVPSPSVFKRYIDEVQKKKKCRIEQIDFRDKSLNGWADHIEKYDTDKGDEFYSKNWTNVFYRHILFRESCYSCKYTTTNRKSDFTIADYWGIGKNAPEFDDNRGCSLVLIQSEKARIVFNEIKEYLEFKKTNIEKSLQPQLIKPIWKGWDYNYFWRRYKKNPSKTINMFFFPNRITKGFWKTERGAKDIIKKVLRK